MKKLKSIVLIVAFCTILCGRTAFGFGYGIFNMEIICGIYKITSPSQKIYIGQSINIYKRWKYEYKKLHCKSQCLLYRSFVKYGVENHIFEIIHQCEREQLNELEKYYVGLFQTFNSKHGLNLRDGGNNFKHSKETCDKISKSNIGKSRSEEQKQRISDAHKGQVAWNKGLKNWRPKYKHSEETRKKMSVSAMGNKRSKGIIRSEEFKQNVSKKNKGKHFKTSPNKGKRFNKITKHYEQNTTFCKHGIVDRVAKSRGSEIC